MRFLEGALTAQELKQVQAHLDRCSDCLALVVEAASPPLSTHAATPGAACAPVPAGPAWTPPAHFDGYRMVRLLGRGGMGLVYLAHDTLLERPVAIKFIAAAQPDAEQRERFRIEAQALARVQHPNVVHVHRVGEVDGRPYLLTEYLRGSSLADLALPVPWQRALEYGLGLARGLAVVHRSNVLHRDIKPANIKLSADDSTGDRGADASLAIKLIDFGLAKLPSAEEAAPPSPPGGPPMTRAGTRLGTFPYASPEVWERGEPATRRSDVYSLGVVLYELCAGRPPPPAAAAGPALLAEVPDLPPAFAALIERCLAPDPAERFPSGEELRDALMLVLPRLHMGAVPAGNPYRGLAPFEAEHRGLFFGRSVEIRALLERLRGEPVVLVAGDSGVGKSSLCRAGVLPLVAEGGLGPGRSWSIVRLVPGRLPLAALCAAVAPLLGHKEEPLLAWLRSDPAVLSRELRQHLGETRGLLIFIDQVEELFTISAPAEAELLDRVLEPILSRPSGACRVLLTVRGDYLTRLAALPSLGAELPRLLYVLRPLSSEGIREAVVGPAQGQGLRFESAVLIDELVASYAHTAGGLPLLQFALAELWEARDQERQLIPAAALSRMGGVAAALGRHADGVLAELLPEQRRDAQRILLLLISAEQTRARRPRSELCAEGASSLVALEVLVRGRLLVAQGGEGDPAGALYEVAHEALIRGWATLRGWIDVDAGLRAVRARAEVAAAEWHRMGRGSEGLWSARQLREVAEAQLDATELSAQERAFLLRSRRGARRRLLLRVGLATAVPFALALAYGGSSLRLRIAQERSIAAHLDVARAALARARAANAVVEGLRRAAFARFDREDTDVAETTWTQATEQAAGVRAAYGEAGHALESALLLDGRRASLRRELADTLYEQALVAERDHRKEQVEELLRRLVTYDDGAVLRGRWREVAQLTLASAQQDTGVEFSIKRYEVQGGRRVLGPVVSAGRSPATLGLSPGSYLLMLSAPGRVPLRYPLLLARGERLRVAPALLSPAEIPAGFVYVPPGRFLFGSAHEDGFRTTLYAPPQHAVETAGYLIGRTEVTLGQWLEFLRTLPERERQERRPHAGPTPALIDVVELPSGSYVLSFRRGETTYSAGQGALLRYEGRQRRAAVDWQRLPVLGVSPEDTHAYAAWLDRSGRVPRARMCTDQEWERAARGADERLYPHGDRLDLDDANIDQTYGRNELAFGPDEVGSHAVSDSPFGVADMAGNAWEWTGSTARGSRTFYRGGGWYEGLLSSLSVNRWFGEPTLRNATIGVRVCATVRPRG